MKHRVHKETIAKGIDLWLGDCFDVLPSLKNFDAVITDPPYGMNYKRGGNSTKSISTTKKVFTETIHGDDKPFDPTPWLKWDCCFIGAQWFYDRLPPKGSLHVWNKRGGYKQIDQADGDLIWLSKRTNLRIIDLVWRGICRKTEYKSKIEHPTQKPIRLMIWCIEQFPDASIILDPYMGSGTTGVACVQQGRKFIGIEHEPKFFDIACRRIEGELEKPSFFVNKPKIVHGHKWRGK